MAADTRGDDRSVSPLSCGQCVSEVGSQQLMSGSWIDDGQTSEIGQADEQIVLQTPSNPR
jgi:hypothetical protein